MASLDTTMSTEHTCAHNNTHTHREADRVPLGAVLPEEKVRPDGGSL